MEENAFLSDIVGDAYKDWKPGDIIGFFCGTGTGKTVFSLGTLAKTIQAEGKSILYLSNRDPLERQSKEDVKKFGLDRNLIKVMNYQKLQSDLESKGAFRHYDCIFADECHYMFSDAMINPATDLTYEYLMNRDDSVVIMMSATSSLVMAELEKTGKVKPENIYRLDQDYSYVDKVIVYDSDAFFTLVDNLLAEDADSKILCIVNEKRMSAAYKKYGKLADYMCSKNTKNRNLRKMCGITEVKQMGTNGRGQTIRSAPEIVHKISDDLITFDKRLLFSTRVLENGVSLKDRRIKAIFCELFDPEGIIQSIGRKRSLGDDDSCTVYIRKTQTNWLTSTLETAKRNVVAATVFLEDNERFRKAYLRQSMSDDFRKDYDVFITDENEQLQINKTRYNQYLAQRDIYTRMVKDGFVESLPYYLGNELGKKIEMDQSQPEPYDLMIEYLISLQGRNLYKEDKVQIKNQFKTIGLNLGKVVLKGKRPPGIAALNGVLDTRYGDRYAPRFINKDPETGKPLRDYRRILPDGSDNPHYKDNYWLLR